MSENVYKEAWNCAMEELHNEYKSQGKESEFIFNFNMNYVEDNINTVIVSVASNFMKSTVISKGSLSIIEKKLCDLTGLNIKVECIVKSDSENSSSTASATEEKISLQETAVSEISEQPKIEAEKVQFKQHPQLNSAFTFDSFIPGDNSIFAYNASISVAKDPGITSNPVLIYGGSGLGKTHLMHAIGNYIYNNNPKLKICYISAENFTNEFLESLKNKKTTEFKNKYRNLDVLLLDDIHFLENKIQTQEELFHTFTALYDTKKQMVFTCDRPIKETKNMAERLVSRLSNGLSIDISVPNYETRYAILQKKLDLKEKSLDSEIIEYIAKNIETNVRELEGALNTLLAYSNLTGLPLTLDIVKKQLKDIINTNNAENISLDTICKVIAENYQISVEDLKGKKRDKKFVIPRQIAIYIARKMTEISYMELGKEFSKDHSTIMHAYEKIEDEIKVDPIIDSKIQLFIREIKEYKK